ncbi:hypothetical protein T4B_11525 [Trichinella pseudospiralis]|uniref:Uncharacterized protein n=1 Tax=Trichinella pseudospiralis TaxID=6337 RepID=A0A0V1JJQ6_TRIPS|nr:hypothetical protein T4B_11525 [Trichinella pseudospiralis]KRZ35224.1 hypothetical protein T4C_8074 [Trichinella pseudospiralis]
MTKHRDHFASRQNIKLKACRIDGCFLRQQERVSPCQVDRGRCRIFFVPKGKKPSAEKQEKEKKEVDGGKQRDEGEGQGLEKEGRLAWVVGRVHSNASKLLGGAKQPPQVNSHRDGQLLANGQEHRQTAARGYPLCKTSLNASSKDFRHASLEQC